MSVCEFYPDQSNVSSSSKLSSTNRKLKCCLQEELIWGLSYRHNRKLSKLQSLQPKGSPAEIPFKLCREKQRQEKQKQKMKQTHISLNSKTSKTKSSNKLNKQPSYLQRSIMSQDEYMEYLSVPRKIKEPAPSARKKFSCQLEPCPPRLIQLAVPNKRRVYENWKTYHQMLPPEVILRYEQLLETNKNLEPSHARYYYKKLDKKEKKHKKKMRKRKLSKLQKKSRAWLMEEIEITTEAILQYIIEQPLFDMNYKQLTFSDNILEKLHENDFMKKPVRSTKSHYKKTIIEIADKLAIWMDTMTRFVDVQVIDSEEDIPPLSISSINESEDVSEEEWGENEDEWFEVSEEGEDTSTITIKDEENSEEDFTSGNDKSNDASEEEDEQRIERTENLMFKVEDDNIWTGQWE